MLCLDAYFSLFFLIEDVNNFKPKIHYSVQGDILKLSIVIKMPNILVCLLKSQE